MKADNSKNLLHLPIVSGTAASLSNWPCVRARLPVAGDPIYWARRLEIVRCFARYLAATEPCTELPPRSLGAGPPANNTPYRCGYGCGSGSSVPLDTWVHREGCDRGPMLRSSDLLATTGLRISEALHLKKSDANLDRRILTIRETKFRKTPWSLHPKRVTELRHYADVRERLTASCEGDHFFVSDVGQPLPYSTVRTVFCRLCMELRIMGTGLCRPRLHDLRHTFACRRVERWYDAGVNLDGAITALSVYLGHARSATPTGTSPQLRSYWHGPLHGLRHSLPRCERR